MREKQVWARLLEKRVYIIMSMSNAPATILARCLLTVAFCLVCAGQISAVTLYPDDILVGDDGFGDAKIIRVNPLTGAQTIVSQGGFLDAPYDLTVGPDGFVYVANNAYYYAGASNTVIKIDPSDGSQTVVYSASTNSALFGGIRFDHSGKLNVIDALSGYVLRVDPIAGTSSVVAAGGYLTSPYYVDVAPDGNLVVADTSGSNSLVQVNPVTGAQTLLAMGTVPGTVWFGVGVKPGGFAFVVDEYSAGVLQVDLTAGTNSIIAQGGNMVTPFGLHLDNSGNVLVTDWDNGSGTSRVIRIDPLTGNQTVVSSGDNIVSTWTLTVVIPEPSTLMLAAGALTVFVLARRRR